MQTQTETKGPTAVRPLAAGLESSHVEVDSIRESKTNPRKEFGDLGDLAASIKQQGILSPLVLRYDPNAAGVELVCGARRLRAAKLAGLKTVPAILLNCTNEEALELQIVENSQRQDVHPMDEAEAYDQLIGLAKGAVQDPIGFIASRCGRSRLHVQRRVKLLDLPKKARDAYRDGTINFDVAVLIARLADPKVRAEVIDRILKENWNGAWTPEDVTRLVDDEFLMNLKTASFDLADANLVPAAGSCGTCPKRTGNQAELFGDVKAKDTCTDRACYRSKADASWAKIAAKAKAEGTQVLTGEQSRKAFPAAHGQLRDERFIDAEEQTYVAGKYQKPAAVLKAAGIKPVLAQRPNGSIATLYPKREAEAAIAKASRGKGNTEQMTVNGKTRDGINARKIEIEAKRRLKVAVIAKVAAGVSEHKFLRAVGDILVTEMADYHLSNDDKEMRKRYPGKRSKKALLEESKVNVLRAAILDFGLGSMGRSIVCDNHIEEVGSVVGLRLADYVAEVKAEKKVKKKAAKK